MQQEFVFWPQIQLEIAAENFLFALEEDIALEEKQKIRSNSLEEKLDQIRRHLRAAFDALMKQDIISVIAQREIPAIIRQKKNRHLIPLLMDLNYSNQHFHATQYPILATAPMLDSSGHEKSYADPVLRIGKTNYYLTAQWNKDHIDLLIDWIWQHR